MSQTSATSGEQAADKKAIRSFQVNIPEAELTELRGRINPTKWPERETVTVRCPRVRASSGQWRRRISRPTRSSLTTG